MATADDRIAAEAIAWRLRTPEMDGDDWLRLTAWLEADPRHAAAYDHVVQSEADGDLILAAAAAPTAATPPAADPADRDRSGRRRWRAGMLAAAAALVAAIGVGTTMFDRPATPGPRMIATTDGETRSIRLADGSRISLNGASRLEIAPGDDRKARLIDGQAFFEIVHRPDRPFELRVGPTTLRDVGTAFDVTRRADGIAIAVRDGAVAVDPEGGNVILGAGRGARLLGGALVVGSVEAGSVGGWREGHLAFRDAPLGDVAADLGRTLGKRIDLDPALRGRRFSGTIHLADDGEAMRARLAGLLGIEVIAGADRWQWRSAARADR